MVFGFWPRLLTDKIKPSAEAIVKMATATKAPEAKVQTAQAK
jgi:hypothetical protein